MEKVLRHAQLDNCNYLWKALSESPSQAHSFPLWKIIFSTIAVTFYKIQQPLHSPNMQPASAPSPPTSWLVKCVIHRVRNFKCVFLKSLLLYQLTSRQHFYFGNYWREIPETWDNQRPIVSRCNEPKYRNILTFVTWHWKICPLGLEQNKVISR